MDWPFWKSSPPTWSAKSSAARHRLMMLRMQYSAAISSLYMNEWELHGVATLDSTRKGSGEGGAKFEVSRDSVAATALLAELVRAGEAAFHSTAATIHARNENVVYLRRRRRGMRRRRSQSGILIPPIDRKSHQCTILIQPIVIWKITWAKLVQFYSSRP